MAQASPNAIVMPEWFIRFIGAVEVLGALGLILPGAAQAPTSDFTRCFRTHDHHDRRCCGHNHG